MEKMHKDQMTELNKDLHEKENALGRELFAYLIGRILDKYPCVRGVLMVTILTLRVQDPRSFALVWDAFYYF